MALSVKLERKNLQEVIRKLGELRKKLDANLPPAARGVTVILLGMVLKTFAAAGRGDPPKDWPPLSPITLFIRKHRASAPNKKANMLNDRGILRNSNFPFVLREGAEFGIVNNLKYASTHQFGGTVPPGTVEIGRFKRKNSRGSGTHFVGPYTMKLKGGKVPARPFFPEKDEYLPVVMKALRNYAKQSRGDLG